MLVHDLFAAKLAFVVMIIYLIIIHCIGVGMPKRNPSESNG